MTLSAFIEQHYSSACEVQRGITRDAEMIVMLRSGRQDGELVRRWMQDYGLFQGTLGADRTAVVAQFLAIAKGPVFRGPAGDDAAIGAQFSSLYSSLYEVVPRTWTSATSKLLWCLHPETVVIYDSFVHRAVLVLQCVDPALREFPRVGWSPSVETAAGIRDAVAHYMNYQAIVRKLATLHGPLLQRLRNASTESYPYDIRILDKLLWMIGNADYELWRGEA